MLKQSENINEIAQAMISFQGAVKPVKMNRKNDFLKTKYADLVAVTDTIRDLAYENNIAYIQSPDFTEGNIGVHTLLVHSSGQWVSGYLSFPLEGTPKQAIAQTAGTLISYARRYALAAMFGLVADSDTDGNNHKTQQKAPAQQVAMLKYADGTSTQKAAEIPAFNAYVAEFKKPPLNVDVLREYKKANNL